MLMIKPVPYSPAYSTRFIDPNDLQCSKSPPRIPWTICCSLRNYDSIPKREPFSRSNFGRLVIPDPPLIQKVQNELSGTFLTLFNFIITNSFRICEQIVDFLNVLHYCTTLEGEECCRCWEAYFEFKKLEKEVPKRDIERLISNASGDMEWLIQRIRGSSDIYKSAKKENNSPVNAVKREETAKVNAVKTEEKCPVPDGIPKSQEEMEEEEKWRMPESDEIRMLRAIGGYPSWYIARPDHETD
ncbi:hypothetical protein LguiA_008896 [Lonicera macranthoides]